MYFRKWGLAYFGGYKCLKVIFLKKNTSLTGNDPNNRSIKATNI